MGSRPARRDVQRRFWRLIRSGVSSQDAAADVGVSRNTGLRWFSEAGGMPPLSLVEPQQSYRLSIADREQILAGMSEGASIREIARRIGRVPSTVQREIERNLAQQQYRSRAEYEGRKPGRARVQGWRYSPNAAQQRADQMAARPKTAKLAANARLRAQVQDRLEAGHSPEQIAHRLPVDFPDDAEMRVSPETIYTSIYVQGRGALRRDLHKCLRTGRALRKPRRRTGPRERRGRIPGMVNISERPAEVADRAVPGHWEGDLITGAGNASAIGTLVERATNFTLLLHLPADHGALAVQDAITAKITQLPQILRKTLTWDQGREMTNHAKIAEATGLAIYFCDPHSPWQRATNENTNGLLRQYFAKGSDLSIYPADYLDYIAMQLNTRPRKRLGWQTPAEALDRLLSNPHQPPGVALTG